MDDRWFPTAVSNRLILTVDVVGRPATFGTSQEKDWRLAVAASCAPAVQADQYDPLTARFAVAVDFRTPAPTHSGEVWDLDNLVKPTLDAMESVFGKRKWLGVPQPADDRVDRLEASKRTVRPGETAGALIQVWVMDNQEAPEG